MATFEELKREFGIEEKPKVKIVKEKKAKVEMSRFKNPIKVSRVTYKNIIRSSSKRAILKI